MQNFESVKNRLLATSVAPGAKPLREQQLLIVTDIKERIEIVHTSQYKHFLQFLLPAFQELLLNRLPPQFIDNQEQKLRNVILEILNRLPNNDVLKPYVPNLLRLVMNVLEKDNEENALICLKVIFDLHKNYRPTLESEVKPFLDFVKETYKRLGTTVSEVFPIRSESRKLLLHSQGSFRVLTECPLIVMLLFQLYPSYISVFIPVLIPLMMNALSIRVTPQPEPVKLNDTKELQASSSSADNKSDAVLLYERFGHLLACQVKMLSFLTFLLRTMPFAEHLRKHENDIAVNVVALLRSCPSDAISTRKELLVATRHILATDFRRGFFNQVNILLDETVLLGIDTSTNGSSQAETVPPQLCRHGGGVQPLVPPRIQSVRPLAYSTLADLVHHVRSDLDVNQLSRVIYLFSRNIHDPTLPLSIQTTSVRLLLNLVDNIFHNDNPDPSQGKQRQLLVLVLDALVRKIGTLRSYIPVVVQAERESELNKEMELLREPVKPMESYYYTRQSDPSRSRTSSSTQRKSNAPSTASSSAEPKKAPMLRRASTGVTEQSVKMSEAPPTVAGSSNNLKQVDENKAMDTSDDKKDKKKDDKVKKQSEDSAKRKQRSNSKSSSRVVDEVVKVMVCKDGHTGAVTGSKSYGVHSSTLTSEEREKARASILDIGNVDNEVCSTRVNTVKDVKVLLKTVILGLKTVVWCVSNYGRNGRKKQFRNINITSGDPGADLLDGQLLSHDEILLVNQLLQWGLQCLPIYRYGTVNKTKINPFAGSANSNSTKPNSKTFLDEEKEVIEHFAGIFTVLEPKAFTDLFQHRLPLIYANTLRHSPLIVMFKTLAAHSNAARPLQSVLLPFLLARMNKLVGNYAPAENQIFLSELNKLNLSDMQSYLSIPTFNDNDVESSLSFKHVPISGCEAAASLENLGINASDENNHNVIPSDVEASLLSQLFKTSIESTVQFSSEVGGDYRNGTGICALIKSHFSFILVNCVRYASAMTTSSMVEARSLFKSDSKNKAYFVYGKNSYLLLLKSYLRSMNGNEAIKEALHAELKPLIVPIMRSLLRMLQQASHTELNINYKFRSNLISEICLLLSLQIPINSIIKSERIDGTNVANPEVPSNSGIINFLVMLRKPLNIALNAGEDGNNDLVRFALKILEQWINQLSYDDINILLEINPDLDHFEDQSNIIKSLYNLLKPTPALYGSETLRIFGKLGDLGRKLVDSAQNVQSIPAVDSYKFLIDIKWEVNPENTIGNTSSLEIGTLINSIYGFLQDLYRPNILVVEPETTKKHEDIFKAKYKYSSTRLRALTAARASLSKEATNSSSTSLKNETGGDALKAFALNQPIPLPCKTKKLKPKQSKNPVKYQPNHNELEQNGYYKKHGFRFLIACLSQLINFQEIHDIQQQITSSSKSPDELKSERPVLLIILKALFFTASDQDLSEMVLPVLHALVRYITLVSVSNSALLDCTVLNEAIVLSMCSADYSSCSIAVEMFYVLIKTLEIAGVETSDSLLNDLLNRFEAVCFNGDKWFYRLGGCLGLHMMIEKMPLSWCLANQVKLMRPLLYVLNAQSLECGSEVVYHANSSLFAIIDKCHIQPSISSNGDDMQVEQSIEQSVIKTLCSFLLSESYKCRCVVRTSLALLSKYGNKSLSELLQPEMMDLRKKLFDCPLSSLTPNAQLALLETVQFVLTFKPNPWMTQPLFGAMQMPLVTLLRAAIHLTDSVDPDIVYSTPAACAAGISGDVSFLVTPDTKYYGTKPLNGGIYGSSYPFELISYPVALRSIYLQLFCSSLELGSTPFVAHLHTSDDLQRLRNRSIQLCFSSVVSRHKSIVEAAKRTLRFISSIEKIEIVKPANEMKSDQASAIAASKNPVAPVSTTIQSLNTSQSINTTRPVVTSQPITTAQPITTTQPMMTPKNYIIPQEVISQAVGPLLMRLNDYRQMSLPYLQGLVFLIPLFQTHFNQTIGRSLLNHLGEWYQYSKILRLTSLNQQHAAEKNLYVVPVLEVAPWLPGEEVRLSASIIDVFSALQLSLQFMDIVISEVMRLESIMHHYQYGPARDSVNVDGTIDSGLQPCSVYGRLSTPYRLPLLKYLNRFPAEAINYFIKNDRLANHQYSELFVALLNMPLASPLRTELMANNATQSLINITFGAKFSPPAAPQAVNNIQPSVATMAEHDNAVRKAQQRVIELRFQGVRTVCVMSKHCPQWLLTQPAVLQCVLAMWRSQDRKQRLLIEEQLSLRHRRLSKYVCNILMVYFKSARNDAVKLAESVDCLFEMLSILVLRTTTDYAFLNKFYLTEVAHNSSIAARRAVIKKFLQVWKDNEVKEDIKEAALRLLVLPTLSASFQDPTINNSDVVSDQVLMSMVRDMLGGENPSDSKNKEKDGKKEEKTSDALPSPNMNANSEGLQVQLLQLATLLIAHCGRALTEYRKELIRFAWFHLKSDDSSSKQWAYVNICTFIDVYVTPPEIILQVYVALLRAYTTDARTLVNKALDTLTPALPRRLPPSKYIKAIKWTKKLIFDEGHHLPQLTHIWQLVVRHPQLFYQHRAQFVPQMINSLNRLGLPHNCAMENRKLVVDLAELVLCWEKTRQLEASRVSQFRHRSNVVKNNSKKRFTAEKEKSKPGKKIKMINSFGIPMAIIKRKSKKTKNVTTNSSNSSNTEYFSSVAASAATDALHGFKANNTMISMVIHFLLRVTLALAETRESQSASLGYRCQKLFTLALQLVSGTNVIGGKRSPYGKIIIKFAYVAKQLHVLISKTKMRDSELERRKQKSRHSNNSDSSRLEEPGMMCCVLKLLRDINNIAPNEVGKPFLLDCSGDLHLIIEPAFASNERGVKLEFAKYIASLLKSNPLDSKKTPLNQTAATMAANKLNVTVGGSKNKSKKANEATMAAIAAYSAALQKAKDASTVAIEATQRAAQTNSEEDRQRAVKAKNLAAQAAQLVQQAKIKANQATKAAAAVSTTSSGVSPAPAPSQSITRQQPFYHTLATAINRRLLIASDEGQSIVVKNVASDSASGSKASKTKKKTAKSKEEKGASKDSKKTATKDKAVTKKDKKTTVKRRTASSAPLSAAAQAKAAKSQALRNAEQLGASPVGTLHTLRLLQVLCACSANNSWSIEHNIDVSNGFVAATDKFTPALMKLLQKLAKDITTTSTASKSINRSSKSSSSSSQASQNSQALETKTRVILQNSIICVISLIGQRVLLLPSYRRGFIQILLSLLDKLTVRDSIVLIPIIELVGRWLMAPAPPTKKSSNDNGKSDKVLSYKERSAFMAKLVSIDRLSTVPQASSLVESYLNVIYGIYTMKSTKGTGNKLAGKKDTHSAWISKQVAGPYLCGILAPNVEQRQLFFNSFCKFKLKNKQYVCDKMKYIFELNWSCMKNRFWLPAAINVLITSILFEDNYVGMISQQNSDTVVGNSNDMVSLLANNNEFVKLFQSLKQTKSLINPLIELAYGDGTGLLSYVIWTELFPSAYSILDKNEKPTIESVLQNLFASDYFCTHQQQQTFGLQCYINTIQQIVDEMPRSKSHILTTKKVLDPYDCTIKCNGMILLKQLCRSRYICHYNVIQPLLESLLYIKPNNPIISPELLEFIGVSFNSLYVAITMAEEQYYISNAPTGNNISISSGGSGVIGERWTRTLDSLYAAANDNHMELGLLVSKASNTPLLAGIAYELRGMHDLAQRVYERALERMRLGGGNLLTAKSLEDDVDMTGDKQSKHVVDIKMSELDLDLDSELLMSNTEELLLAPPGEMIRLVDQNNAMFKTKFIDQFELETWENRWLVETRNLNEWNTLLHVSHSLGDAYGMLEASFRQLPSRSDWSLVKDLLSSPSIIAQQEYNESQIALYNLQISLLQGKSKNEIDILYRQAVDKTLSKMQSSNFNTELISSFQLLVEIYESITLLSEVNRAASRSPIAPAGGTTAAFNATRAAPGVRHVLSEWNRRFPSSGKWLVGNAYQIWDNLLKWRINISKHIISTFRDQALKRLATANKAAAAANSDAMDTSSSSDQLTTQQENVLCGMHDMSSSLLRLAHINTLVGVPEMAVSILDELYNEKTLSIDISAGFYKLREEMNICLTLGEKEILHSSGMKPETRKRLVDAIEMMKDANAYRHFDPKQKAELFRYQTLLMSITGNSSVEVNNAYINSIQQAPDGASLSWLQWCHYTDNLLIRLKPFELLQQKEYAGHVVACLFQALQQQCIEAHLLIPRLLQLLRYEYHLHVDSTTNVSELPVTIAFNYHVDATPTIVWLPYMQQLVESLLYNESICIEKLLNLILKQFPQQVYYTLNRFLQVTEETKRVLLTKRKSDNTVANASFTKRFQVAHDTATRIMYNLSNTHPLLVNELRFFCNHIVSCVNGTTERCIDKFLLFRPQFLEILTHNFQNRVKLFNVSAFDRRDNSEFDITLNSYNGTSYKFAVEQMNAIDYSKDLHMIQVRKLLNSILDANTPPTGYQVPLKYPLASMVPLSLNLRMHLQLPDTTTFKEIYDHSLQLNGVDSAAITDFAAGETMVSPDILIEFFNDVSTSSYDFYKKRQRLTVSLALSNLLAYLMASSVQTSKLDLRWSQQLDTLIDYSVKPHYSDSTGLFVQDNPVPFRLTRNIRNLISLNGVNGTYVDVISQVSSFLVNQTQQLENRVICLNNEMHTNERCLRSFLALFIYDDLFTWYNTTDALNESETQKTFGKMNSIVNANVAITIEKLSLLAPDVNTMQEQEQARVKGAVVCSEPPVINQHVRDLVEAASDPDNLSKMPNCFVAWF